ncbi:phosphoglycerate mutase [Haemophilus paracuniculus]|uniref:phosphoglycerate mutase (2,3-diphosphoglycerate-dependent) n=1 Tax=Haemophilus paracuniculus TaxID=734 RepID=A0A1T0AU08_9PAST|nr:histidine phosphatase family protein [Haemophilus paracuniculus]OOR99612.1 phosphoglycerate mutase [Haemophilus paracuniculus]
MAVTVYLIRHGRTEWNLEGRLQGSDDSPLVAEGIEGAKRTGQALAEVPFAACYSSLLKRAQDTANYILGERQIPHFHHQGLNELDFGSWEGQKSVDLYDNEEYWTMKKTPAEYQAKSNGGETMAAFAERVQQAFWQIVGQHQEGENILIVSHGMTLTLLTAVLKGLSWHDFRDEEKHSFVLNTAINVVEVENGTADLVQFNQIEHLA